MKGLRIVGVAFFAMLVLSAVSTSSASADLEVCTFAEKAGTGLWDINSNVNPDGCEGATTTGPFELYEVEFLLASWLEGGATVTANLPVQSEGELELVSLKAGGLSIIARMLCSVILDGWVGPASSGFISELLTLAGVLIPLTVLEKEGLLCTNIENCTEPEVWASKLGWETEIELLEMLGVGSIFVTLILNAGWYIQCLNLGVTSFETCEFGEIAVKSTNEANGTVDNEFSETNQQLAGLHLLNCTLGGNSTGEINGLVATLEAGVTLSVSSE
jgi:hypothetical protein